MEVNEEECISVALMGVEDEDKRARLWSESDGDFGQFPPQFFQENSPLAYILRYPTSQLYAPLFIHDLLKMNESGKPAYAIYRALVTAKHALQYSL